MVQLRKITSREVNMLKIDINQRLKSQIELHIPCFSFNKYPNFEQEPVYRRQLYFLGSSCAFDFYLE